MNSAPRAATIQAETREAMRSTGLTIRRFAADVAELYRARTHEDDRTVDFHASADPYADERANAQLVTRILNSDVRFPADLEEAWVLSLPETHRARLLSTLAGRYGLLAVPLAKAQTDPTLRVAALLRETADAVQALAPMVHAGAIDARCLHDVQFAIAELRDVEAAAAGLRVTLADKLRAADPTRKGPAHERL